MGVKVSSFVMVTIGLFLCTIEDGSPNARASTGVAAPPPPQLLEQTPDWLIPTGGYADTARHAAGTVVHRLLRLR